MIPVGLSKEKKSKKTDMSNFKEISHEHTINIVVFRINMSDKLEIGFLCWRFCNMLKICSMKISTVRIRWFSHISVLSELFPIEVD